MTYKYFIILFILQGESKVIMKSFNTLWTVRTGWLSGNTVAQKTAPMFAHYIKTHVLLNADIV